MLSDSQAHELHTKHSAEAMKAEKWQFEYKNLHDKYDALLKEKEVSRWEIKVELWFDPCAASVSYHGHTARRRLSDISFI